MIPPNKLAQHSQRKSDTGSRAAINVRKVGLMNFEQVLHCGQVTAIAVLWMRVVRQATAWLRTIGQSPALPEDLACTRRTNLGLQDSTINPGICQMFPNAKHGESGKPKPIPQFFEVEKVIASLGRRTHSGFQPQRILSMLVF